MLQDAGEISAIGKKPGAPFLLGEGQTDGFAVKLDRRIAHNAIRPQAAEVKNLLLCKLLLNTVAGRIVIKELSPVDLNSHPVGTQRPELKDPPGPVAHDLGKGVTPEQHMPGQRLDE